uniref:Uncharacterized protein n=1 Tax=Romanomermis culicivorax TaxID=13658 RepID=A0A915KZU6_ROMCU
MKNFPIFAKEFRCQLGSSTLAPMKICSIWGDGIEESPCDLQKTDCPLRSVLRKNRNIELVVEQKVQKLFLPEIPPEMRTANKTAKPQPTTMVKMSFTPEL